MHAIITQHQQQQCASAPSCASNFFLLNKTNDILYYAMRICCEEKLWLHVCKYLNFQMLFEVEKKKTFYIKKAA
jgi:hypothetical protein